MLLVEDEPSVRNVAARVLTLAGYHVLQASDGAEALEVYDRAAERIALVITDVVMPRIGGPELATRLRAKRPGLKVLFTSGYTEDTLVVQDLDPAQAFLPEAVPAGGADRSGARCVARCRATSRVRVAVRSRVAEVRDPEYRSSSEVVNGKTLRARLGS